MKLLFSASSTSNQITGSGNTKNRKFIYLEDVEYIDSEAETAPKKEDNDKLAWWQSKIAATIGALLMIGSGALNLKQYLDNDKLAKKVKTEEYAKDIAQKNFADIADKLTIKTADYNTKKAELKEFKKVIVIQDSSLVATNGNLSIPEKLDSIIKLNPKSPHNLADKHGNSYPLDKDGFALLKPRKVYTKE